jgi:hypothetical protein
MNSKIKIGIDVHGVIDTNPEFFSFLTNAFISSSGEVHIITGGSWTESLISELNSYGIKWTHHFSVYDYMLNNFKPIGGEIIFPNGEKQIKFASSDWDKAKADYCKENNISLHIDDKSSYSQYFTTNFALFKGF